MICHKAHPSTLHQCEASKREARLDMKGAEVVAPRILIILGSTRQNRQGATVGRWSAGRASRHSGAVFESVDLRDWPLPFLDSPVPPAFGQYDPAARRWAETMDAADGFVFVTPEYNHGHPAVLKNALDHLYREWGHKPAAIVSYGAAGAGTRGVGRAGA